MLSRNRAVMLAACLCLLQRGGTAHLDLPPLPVASESELLVFPQIADGSSGSASIRSSVTLINSTNRRASGTIRFYDDRGYPWAISTTLGEREAFDFSLGAGDVLRFETAGRGALKQGWAGAFSDIALSGAGSFTVLGTDGTFLSEVGIGASAPAPHQLILAESAHGSYSGFALCNPDSSRSARIQFLLRTTDGTPVGSRELTLGPLAHRAEYVTETFSGVDLRNFTGILEVSADLPVSLVTLRTRGDNYTSLPSFDVSAPGEAGRDTTIPRVADGVFGDLRYETRIVAVNGSDQQVEGELELFAADGSAMTTTIGVATASRFTVRVPPKGTVELATPGLSNPGAVGWARMTSDGPLDVASSFTVARVSDSAFVSEVGVSEPSIAARHTLVVQERDGSYTGLALANPFSGELKVRLRLYSGFESGSASPLAAQVPDGETLLTIPAFGALGRYLSELFPDVSGLGGEGFEGRLEVATWSSRFGEDIPIASSILTLISRRARFTSAPAAPYHPVPISLSYFDPQADQLLSEMSLDEKVGQMTQAERGSLRDGDIAAYHLGSVLSGGGSGPSVNSVTAWADMYDGFQMQALGSRLAIPLLYGIDAVHGHNNVRGAVIFPHNIGLGATRNPELVQMAARITASEVRATGINWTFSPVVAVPRDERWGRTYEGFGEDPELVREMAEYAVMGYQGTALEDPSSIVACAKHFIGDGGTTWGTGTPIDQGDTRVDEATLRRIHLPGYLGAIQAGVGTIMVSFSSWNGQKMSGNRYLLTDVLKGELGFEGFLVSDWAAIDQLPGGSYREEVKSAINAGIDMAMVPGRHREFFETLRSLVQAGEVPISRIDDAVRRILRVKFAAGLFDRPPATDRSFQERFGSTAHREVARETVRQSAVLLQNRNAVLPISKVLRRIYVGGANADNLGHQCGGWTISWQGGGGTISDGTTILQAIRRVLPAATQVSYSIDGTGAEGADVGVVVIGESPYAEGVGDNGTLSLSAQDLDVVARVKQAGVPVVVVLVTGRPLILGSVLENADAVLVVWLPGTEGEGVADVLFGDYGPTGRLPCSWPRTIEQVPVNLGDTPYDPLFPFGFGLGY